MEFVPTTLIAIIAVLLILRLGAVRGLWVLFALLPLGAAAAINLPAVGGASVVLADSAAAALCCVILFERGIASRILLTLRPPSPAFFLIFLFVFATFATFFFPRFFAGMTEVFGLARFEGKIGIITRPLQPSSGNVTQFLRFFIGVSVFIFLATAFRRNPDTGAVVKAMIATVLVHVIFGLLDVLTFKFGLSYLLDYFRTANYAMATNQILGGLKRMVGGFPEASAFGYLTLGLLGFWLQYWFDRGRSRYAIWMVLSVLLVLLLSASTSAYVAAFIFVSTFLIINSSQLVSRQVDIRLAVIGVSAFVALIFLATAMIVAYQTVPQVEAFLDRLIFDKLQSNSGQERLSWNLQAYQNYLETWTLGAGLGSVRASNWLIACLASLGTVGTILFLAFVVSLFRTRNPNLNTEAVIVVRSLKMGCAALLIRALIVKATPNLELIFFAMAGLAVGISASAYVKQNSRLEVRASSKSRSAFS